MVLYGKICIVWHGMLWCSTDMGGLVHYEIVPYMVGHGML